MATGSIKFYSDAKGFGFIVVDGAEADMFFHISAWPEDLEALHIPGQRVKFEEGVSPRTGRPQAEKVAPL